MRAAFAFFALLLAAPALADDLARVTAVQPPAWIERAGPRQALEAGRVLKAGDRILTGAGARVHIELAESSIVKLGEDADFRLPQVARVKNDGDTLFKSTIKMLKGAFRFTTRAVARPMKRDVDITIGVATAGVRGTDLWGKADGEQDLIALLEGRIEVSVAGGDKQVMDQPGTALIVPRGQAPLPVSIVPEDRLPTLTAQTEMHEDRPAMFIGGPYSVVIARFDTREAARAEVAKFSAKGYAAEAVEARGDGARHHVVMRGFGSRGDANRFARHLRQAHGARTATFVPNF